jgi:endonuclease-3 related protein
MRVAALWQISDHRRLNSSSFALAGKSMLTNVYQRLLEAFGPQDWWPAESPFEVIVGAVLTQNTSWKNVELAIENLRSADLLDVVKLDQVTHAKLAALIRPAGYFRLKATRLKNVARFIRQHYGGSLDAMFSADTLQLRQQLLSINGVGPETADSILLYAGGHRSFVIDSYTGRVAKRHGWIEPDADYDDLKRMFESSLDPDVELFNEFHALLVVVGKEFCRPTPKCEACPLRDLLPPDGPCELS